MAGAGHGRQRGNHRRLKLLTPAGPGLPRPCCAPAAAQERSDHGKGREGLTVFEQARNELPEILLKQNLFDTGCRPENFLPDRRSKKAHSRKSNMRYGIFATVFALALFVWSPGSRAQESAAEDSGSPGSGVSANSVDQAVLRKIIDKGVTYLTEKGQNRADGSYSSDKSPAITALCTAALLDSGLTPGHPAVAKSLEFILAMVQDNGGIHAPDSAVKNYETSIFVMCLSRANHDGRYDETIRRAMDFLKGIQWDEGENHDASSLFYGGQGYGSHQRPDLSNTSFFLDALKDSGEPMDSDAMQKVMLFVSRTQNLPSQHNTAEWAAKVSEEDRGGFIYSPVGEGETKAGDHPDGGLRSYASMTYTGLKSFLYAGIEPDDLRVRAAWDWIQRNYDLQSNPGVGQQGLYYYYHVFAKALNETGTDSITDTRDVVHYWRKDLVEALARRQQPDGSWVNPTDRWYEGDPNLVTAYSLLALHYCAEQSDQEPETKGNPEGNVSPEQLEKTRLSLVENGLHYLANSGQANNGSFTEQAGSGITALAVAAALRNGKSVDDPMVAKGLKALEAFVKPDGGIYGGGRLKNYETCVAMMAFAEANASGKYSGILADAKAFITGLQVGDQQQQPDDPWYGGVGYSGSGRPDLSNTSFFIEALRAAGAESGDPAIQRAMAFVNRTQNLGGHGNDTEFAALVDDGGFYYSIPTEKVDPSTSTERFTANGGLRSYGSMTYAGFKSMIYAGLTANDPRVSAAVKWIRNSYTVRSNPGMGDAGLYYYYHTFGSAFDAAGMTEVVDADGKRHDWRADLILELEKRQNPDGSWVNSNGQWFENDPNLSTSFALLALSCCEPVAPKKE